MTTAMQLEVPLKVDISAGPNWLDVEEVPGLHLRRVSHARS
jgi:hypothetical protein